MAPVSPSLSTSAKATCRQVAVGSPSTATTTSPLSMPARCAGLSSTIAAFGAATSLPITATSQKKTNASTKFAAGPAAAMAMRHCGFRRS